LLYATNASLGPPESSTQTASRSLEPFLLGSLGDRLADRQTDNAARLVTIGGAHGGEAKLCHCLWLQGVSLGPPEFSTQTASRSLQPFLLGSLGDRSTDRPTDHARWSTQWRSQILLLSTATTSIYWSSRLERSDQLQQSAAVFSCKTRRVAVYVETHYNIASKRPFSSDVLERWQFVILFILCFNVNMLNVNYLFEIKNIN